MPELIPNREQMMQHLHHLFGDQLEGVVELAWSDPITGGPSRAQHFDVGALDDLIETACEKNLIQGQNVYIGAALRRVGTFPSLRAQDIDYLATVAAYVDLDDAEAANGAKERYGACKATLAVVTGNYPAVRGQLWWKLDQAVRNPEDHRQMMSILAAHFHGDATVVNPSRVMRLAGSIAWPFKPGRVAEMTALILPKDGRPAAIFREQLNAFIPASNILDFNSARRPDGDGRAPISGRLSADWLIAEIQGARFWHNRMNQLVGHWVMRGFSDIEILGYAAALTLPGWSVDQTTREMRQSLEGARRKWQKPSISAEFDESTGLPATANQGRAIQFLDLDQINLLAPPTYAIDALVTERGFTLIWGKQASFKSFVALDMALHMAYGQPFHGRETLPKRVLYIAGEGASGFKKRIGAWRKHYDRAGAKGDFHMLATGINLVSKEAAQELIQAIRALPAPFDFIFVDTVARAMLGLEENDASAMGLFIQACDLIRATFPCGLAAVHHSGKDSSLGPRGSNALPAAVDTDFFLERIEGTPIVTVTCRKQKDDEEPLPFRFKAEKIDCSALGIAGDTSLVMLAEDVADTAVTPRALSKAQVNEILVEVKRAWEAGRPWSNAVQAKREGRYLPRWMSDTYGLPPVEGAKYIEDLLHNQFMAIDIADKKTKSRGLRVLKFHANFVAEVAEKGGLSD